MKIRWVHKPGQILGAMREVASADVDMEQLRSELTFSNGAYFQAQRVGQSLAGLKATIELFEEGPGLVRVPRHYEVPWLNKKEAVTAFPWRCASPRSEILSSISLRNDTQTRAARALADTRGDKILCLSCGKGKTVVSLKAAEMAQMSPILVIVNTTALLDQWMERIEEFYGIPRSQIGHIQAETERWEGCQIAIGMLHSISRKRYDPEFYKYWRLIIFDEAHRLGAEDFSQALRKFPGERWGLTATLKRADGNDRMIQMHLGRVAYEDLSQDLKPEVYFLNTGVKVDEGRFYWRGNLNLARLTTWLCENDTRNELILEWVHRAVGRGRTVLVLGERLEQLHSLHERCEAESKAVHIGAQKQDERRAALRHQVVFATQHLAKEGLDRPEFDTLMILIPFTAPNRMQQSIGRIQREVSGKKVPTVLVFEDNISIIAAMARKMKKYFLEQKFKVSASRAQTEMK